jgi:branched-subunit amino acid transport protein AzlD
MINISHSLAIIAVVAVLTLALRATPFVIFGTRKTPSPMVEQLGKFLPPAIMATLVFYCLREIDWFSGGRGMPEIIATTLVIVLHSWKKNILLSVATSTVCYILLIQYVF